jgi:GrpB-like predicted nucleotidyltransferase (UPF0157 family)
MDILLRSADDLLPQVECILDRLSGQIRSLLPNAELYHIGATAIPGALTKGDVDVLLRVSPDRFAATVDALLPHFQIKQQVNWSAEFASFGDDTGYELPVGIQVVATGSELDFLLFLRDYLIANREALEEYNRLKLVHSADAELYWQAKNDFFARILATRTKTS